MEDIAPEVSLLGNTLDVPEILFEANYGDADENPVCTTETIPCDSVSSSTDYLLKPMENQKSSLLQENQPNAFATPVKDSNSETAITDIKLTRTARRLSMLAVLYPEVTSSGKYSTFKEASSASVSDAKSHVSKQLPRLSKRESLSSTKNLSTETKSITEATETENQSQSHANAKSTRSSYVRASFTTTDEAVSQTAVVPQNTVLRSVRSVRCQLFVTVVNVFAAVDRRFEY